MGNGSDTQVADRDFLERVERLRRLRDFIVSEGIDVGSDARPALNLGHLNLLRFARAGRAPTDAEWGTLEEHVYLLFRLLPQDSRKKYLLREYPSSITVIAMLALVLSVLTFFIAIFPGGLAGIYTSLTGWFGAGGNPKPDPRQLFSSIELVSFVLWVVCLSALGSVAFISVNALSIQNDATFDITNGKFVWLRIVLGILFGVIITLPSSYKPFGDFTWAMRELIWDHPTPSGIGATGGATGSATTISPTQIAILIFPFLIGFSASLFMAIINRMVSGVQTMFGIDGRLSGMTSVVPGQPGGGPGAEAAIAVPAAPIPRSILGAHIGGQSIL
jgi:hypothetical protein